MRHLPQRLVLVCLCALLLLRLPAAVAQPAEGRSMIAFIIQDYETRTLTLSLVDPNSGAIVELFNDGNFFFPMLSPDGLHLAFVGEFPRALYMVGTDGSDLREFIETDTPVAPAGQVTWTADSAQVVYPISNSSSPFGIGRANANGSDSGRLELGGERQIVDAWVTTSPDGEQIAFLGQTDTLPYRQLYIVNADGSNPQPVMGTTPDGFGFDRLAWSPDGQRMLLYSDGNYQPFTDTPQPLMIANADGSDLTTLLSPPPNYITAVTWSPDGEQIAFAAIEMSGETPPDRDIFVMNADGSGLRSLNVPINVSSFGISWSIIPDDITLPAEPLSFRDTVRANR